MDQTTVGQVKDPFTEKFWSAWFPREMKTGFGPNGVSEKELLIELIKNPYLPNR